MFYSNSYEEKMLMLEDFDLNSVQQYTDSFKDTFKQTMINQEIVFRKQVRELHRLYSVQRNLMTDLAPVKLEKYDSWKPNALLPPQETRIPSNSFPMMGSTASLSQDLLGGLKDKHYRFQKSYIDLELLPDQYVSLRARGNDLPNKQSVGVNSRDGGDFSDPLELRLSLSLGMTNRKDEYKKRSWSERNINTFPGVVIDLEESIERTLDSGEKHDSQVTITSDLITSKTMKMDSFNDDADNSLQDQNYSRQGVEHGANFPYDNLLTRKRRFISNGVERLDLNEVHIGDSSHNSHDAIVANQSTTSLSGDFSGLVRRSEETLFPSSFCKREATEFPNNTFEKLQQNDGVNLASKNLNYENRRKESPLRNFNLNGRNECEESLNGPESESSPQINLCEELGNHSGIAKNGKDELLHEFQNAPAHDLIPVCVDNRQVGVEEIEARETVLFCSDQIQTTTEDKHHDMSSVSWKSSCISDNDLRTVVTDESGMEPLNSNRPASDQFSSTHGGSHIAETSSGELDRRSSDSNAIKHECYNRKEESPKMDDSMQIAAESLIHISLETTSWYQESSTRVASNESHNEDKEQPQCSSDSFELMTLKLTESTADDYSVSSKPFEPSDSQRKDFGIKLRRGRRLKDFQRDILPGLASLSRHEIREDINILEGVLRSREYKKMRAKMGNGEKWCTPVRSRRSRLNYVGRKTFR